MRPDSNITRVGKAVGFMDVRRTWGGWLGGAAADLGEDVLGVGEGGASEAGELATVVDDFHLATGDAALVGEALAAARQAADDAALGFLSLEE